MKAISLVAVRAALAALALQPRRALGQNFLVDENLRDILLNAARLEPGDRVLEVGPGLGALTEELVRRVALVRAVERDPRLHGWLAQNYAGVSALDLRLGDAVDLDFDTLAAEGFGLLVSNLPYAAGSRVLMNAFLARQPPRRIVVTVQREVGDRMAARPATRAFGLMALWAQMLYRVERIRLVPRGCFFPRPDVESAIMRLEALPDDPMTPAGRRLLHRLSKVVFEHRRKQMLVSLRDAGAMPESDARALLEAAGIEPNLRPEQLPMAAWRRLGEAAAERMPSATREAVQPPEL